MPLDADAKDFVFIGEFRDVRASPTCSTRSLASCGRTGRRRLAMAGSGPPRRPRRASRATARRGSSCSGAAGARGAAARALLVVPSLAESLPYVVLEGTAAERPVIATDVGGVAEIFGPTADRLVPPADAAALAAAMRRALDAPDDAAREAAERLAFVAPRFAVGHMTDAIEALYHEVLAARRHG